MLLRQYTLVIPLVLLAASLGVVSAQGPPEGVPGGADQPTGGANDDQRPGASSEAPRGPPVEIEDARDGFGARPAHAGTGRPAFSYDAGRAAMAMERAGTARLEVVSDALLEFRDEDGDGRYGIGEPVVQRLAVRDLEVHIEASDDERRVIHALPGGGHLTFRFQLAPEDVDQATKFDVIIVAFPFQANDTLLALGMRADVPKGVAVGHVAGDAALVGSDTGEVPYLSWVSTANVDGIDRAVGATAQAGASGGSVFWTYAAGNEIIHDPILGVILIDPGSLFSGAATVAGIGVAALVMAVGFEARRRVRP